MKPCLTVICSHIVSTILSRRMKPRKRMFAQCLCARIPFPFAFQLSRVCEASILQLASPFLSLSLSLSLSVLFSFTPAFAPLSLSPSIYNLRERLHCRRPCLYPDVCYTLRYIVLLFGSRRIFAELKIPSVCPRDKGNRERGETRVRANCDRSIGIL